jgi:GNAT superfamily N-acetyltransferase
MPYTIRPATAADEARWRELWIAYCAFYEWVPSEAILQHAWQRIMDPAAPVHSVLAEDENGLVQGLVNYVLHENVTALTPVCYLQDLFVDPAQRAHGLGKQMIDWMVEKMHAEQWSRLYWNTRENNYRARGLYDKYTEHSGFVRYVISHPELDRRRIAEPQ